MTSLEFSAKISLASLHAWDESVLTEMRRVFLSGETNEEFRAHIAAIDALQKPLGSFLY